MSFKFLSQKLQLLTNDPRAKFYIKQLTEKSQPGSFVSEFVLFLNLSLFWKEEESFSLYKWRWNRVELLPKFRQQILPAPDYQKFRVMPTDERL